MLLQILEIKYSRFLYDLVRLNVSVSELEVMQQIKATDICE